MVTCSTMACNSNRLGKLKRKKIHITLITQFVYQKAPFCHHMSKAISVLLVPVWDSCTAESLLIQMQRVLLKLRFHQTISAPPCPTTKIHRFGWYSGVCARGFCHVLSIRDHTSSHPKSPEPQQQKECHSPCLSCVLPFEVSPAQLWKGYDSFSFFWPNKATAVGPSGEAELSLHNFDMMAYNGAGNLHTAVSFITVITPVSSTRPI